MATPKKAKPGESKRVGKRELRAFLEQEPRERLIEQIMALFTEFEPVRQHYHGRLRGEDADIRERYKSLIRAEFATRGHRPPPMRAAAAKRAVADYRKVATSPEGIADVMFYYAEAAMWPFEEFGLDHYPLLNSVFTMYRDALVHVRKHGLDREFVDRSHDLVQRGASIGYEMEFQEIHDLAYGLPDEED